MVWALNGLGFEVSFWVGTKLSSPMTAHIEKGFDTIRLFSYQDNAFIHYLDKFVVPNRRNLFRATRIKPKLVKNLFRFFLKDIGTVVILTRQRSGTINDGVI